MNQYVDFGYYFGTYRGSVIPGNELNKRMQEASAIVDILTYGNIDTIGWDNVTDFEKEKIQKATCLISEFYKINEKELNMIVSSYSIDGVTATFFSSHNVCMDNGVYVPTLALQLLNQTCFRNNHYYF